MPAKQRGGSWKRAERFIAQAFGVVRTINNGKAQADVQIPGFSVESKKVKQLPAILTNAMRQARTNTLPGRHPLLVIFKPQSAGSPTERLVVMDFSDFLELHQKAYAGATIGHGRDTGAAQDSGQLPDAGATGGAGPDRKTRRRAQPAESGGTPGDGDSREPPAVPELGTAGNRRRNSRAGSATTAE